MARAFASRIITAPVGAVWNVVRDFNGLPKWHPAIRDSEIEGGAPADQVGAIRAFHLQDGALVRERLLSLDDSRYSFSYNFETPAFPVSNYRAGIDLIPVTKTGGTYVQWWAEFDEAPEDQGKYVDIISAAVFSAGLEALAEFVKDLPAVDEPLWQGWRPAKVFVSTPMAVAVDCVWQTMRDFAGMDGWHPDIRSMAMLQGAPSDRVSAVRDFQFGAGQLHEQLTLLSDTDRAFRYRILKSPQPWMNYHAGARLWPVTADNSTLAVWTADWVASPNDDVTLIPLVHDHVFQLALDTLEAKLQAG